MFPNTDHPGTTAGTHTAASPLVIRRLGLATLPLAVSEVLIGSQAAKLALAVHGWNWTCERATKCAVLGVLVWLCSLTIKPVLGVNFLIYVTSRAKYMDVRVNEDEDGNKFGRNPIGERKDEPAYNRELETVLHRPADHVGGEAGQKEIALEDSMRFTMVK